MLTSTYVGSVGAVGEIDVNVETGVTNASTQKETLLQQAEQLAKTLPVFQTSEITDTRWLAKSLKPTHKAGKPGGDLRDLLPTR